jgi:predicted transcriptional regulator
MMREDANELDLGTDETLRMTADIVASFVTNNKLSPEQLPELIRSVHKTIESLIKGEAEKAPERPKPAVAIGKSVHNDYIVCLEDGKRLKMLKRYLRSTYNMSPDEYRKRWGLPADYPMVAPAYAAKRSEFAKRIGLGRGVRRKDA